MDSNILTKVAHTIRGLSIDAIEAANSGHPGLPLGCAELGAYLFSNVLRYNPKNPDWVDRDRFILSAGHGSMLQYSLLHLSGYDLSIQDLKNFRQLHSPCAGHPEYKECPGVETTTGPLGQGIATAVGVALGQKIVAAQLDADTILNNTTYVLVGDGCIMEGVSSEASSLAGHWKLDNLVVIYDANDICLDGPVEECLTEDVAKRYDAYGWNVLTIDGHDFTDIKRGFDASKNETNRPTLIIAKTVIGKGAPSVEGTSEVHGKALGADESKRTKEALGIPLEPTFYVPQEVTDFFNQRTEKAKTEENEWNGLFKNWSNQNPDKAALLQAALKQEISADFSARLSQLDAGKGKASRASSSSVIQFIHDELPFVMGGSADLSCSDSTFMKASNMLKASDFNQRNIKYGPREFAMATIASGLALQGMIKPFIGTFLTFSDYMKNAIRLAALMKLPVIYQFTHDSIFLGEDGPTHQPVEHVASLRLIPGVTVVRPGDSTEVKAAWNIALKNQGPTALILTRQGLPEIEATDFDKVENGAYVIQGNDSADYHLIATGSELNLAIESAKLLEEKGYKVRVISAPCLELFELQSDDYKASILDQEGVYCSIEAGSTQGWYRYIGRKGLAIGVDTFGLSAPASDVANEFGLNAEAIVKKLISTKNKVLSSVSS